MLSANMSGIAPTTMSRRPAHAAVNNETSGAYTLAWKLNPAVQVGTSLAGVAFADIRDTTERLTVRGLVRGERVMGSSCGTSQLHSLSSG